MNFDLDSALDRFWQAGAGRAQLSEEWHDRLTLDQAYAMQLGMAARRCEAGERQIGWKVGLTTEAVQRQLGFHEPVFGCVLDRVSTGHELNADELYRPGIEPELCVQLKRSLPCNPSLDEVWAAVEVCYPALEIIEARGDIARHTALVIADNALHKTIVLGNAVPLPAVHALAEIAARVDFDGRTVATGLGEAVLGNPLNAVRWLSDKLRRFSLELKAGDLIMTGSFTHMCPIGRGNRVRVEFAGIGSVRVGLSR